MCFRFPLISVTVERHPLSSRCVVVYSVGLNEFLAIAMDSLSLKTSAYNSQTVLCACYQNIECRYPWIPTNPGFLLGVVSGLGAFSGIAFAASYQLAARYANKNTIALGLGCIASGPLVLIMQLLIGVHSATAKQSHHVALYGCIAGLVAISLWATVSLLLRHWESIESIYKSEETENPQILDSLLLCSEEHVGGESPRSLLPRRELLKHPSLPPLAAYGWLEPFETFIPTSETLENDGIPASRSESIGRFDIIDAHHRQSEMRRSHSDPLSEKTKRISVEPTAASAGLGIQSNRAVCREEEESLFSSEDRIVELASGVPANTTSLSLVIREAFPALMAIGIQSGVALTLFPFFTYIPSSGLIEPRILPTILFWIRVFADIAGRLSARVLCPSSSSILVVVAFAKLASEPLFFLYIKLSPGWFYGDAMVALYVSMLWFCSGWLNSAANMVGPKLVPVEHRSQAAGLMALTYQLGHILALVIAAILAYWLFGDSH